MFIEVTVNDDGDKELVNIQTISRVTHNYGFIRGTRIHFLNTVEQRNPRNSDEKIVGSEFIVVKESVDEIKEAICQLSEVISTKFKYMNEFR